MIVAIDPASATPPYAQIQDQITTMVRNQVLAPGDRLPAIRHLARDLDVAVNTVARAYRELEANGLVASRGRHGTSVLERAHSKADSDDLAVLAESFAREASQRGLGVQDVVTAVRSAFLHLDQPRSST